MQTGNTFIVHPSTPDQINALKAFIKALKIKFEITGEEVYNPEFVAKIQESSKEFEEGKFKRVKKEDLQNFLGL